VRLRASLPLTLRALAFFTDEGRRTGDVRTAAGADRVFGADNLFTFLWTEAERVTIYYTQGKLHTRLERLGVLGADPHGVLLVDAGRTGQGSLGQGADGDKAAHDRQGLLTLADALAERLVAVGLGLDRVVPVLGQHTTLELADNLGALTGRTDVLGGNGRHAAQTRLADVRVPGAVTASHSNNAASHAADMTGAQGRLHLPFIKKSLWRDPS